MTRLHRTTVVAAGVAAIVLASNASSGSYFSQSWGWVALAFLVPTTVLVILARVTVPGRLRIAFAVLVGALAAWIALSSVWSLSPSSSVREVERMLVYVAVSLAIALVLRRGDGPGVYAGCLVGVVGVTAYGLATRLFPDRFGFDDDPFNAYRLAEPVGYWNTFGLVATLGALLAVGMVAHTRRASFAALAAASLPVSIVALYFTFSRGSWVAFAFGVAATIALDPRRLRLLATVVVLAPASIAAVGVASGQEALTTEGAAAAAAEREGHRLAVVLVVLILVSAALGWIVHRATGRLDIGVQSRRIADVALAAGALALVAAALIAAGGPSAALSDLRERFEAAPTASRGDLNDRLFSLSSNGRVETMGVAWDVGRDNLLAGRGAGTFEYVWYAERPSLQVVRDAHSLYAEAFSEIGIVGLALLVAALTLPVAAAVRARRTRFVAPAVGAYLAWAGAAGLDWHWEMVGPTSTALLVGSVALLSAERRSRPSFTAGSRLALVGVTGSLSILAVVSLVGNQALFAGRDAVERGDGAAALDHARRAQALLPWSHEPELVLGDARARLGDRAGALAAYREAVAEDGESWVAWFRLARVARGAERAAAYDRVRELNPREEGLLDE